MQIAPFDKSLLNRGAELLGCCVKDPLRELSEYTENPAVTVFGLSDEEGLWGFCKEKGAERMLLEVREKNSAARALYESFGFEQISVRKNYYSHPTEDAIIYRREL